MSLPAERVGFEEMDGNSLVLAQGDQIGFRMLFECYYGSLCTYAAGFVGTKDVAEEVVQAVFVQLWYRCERSDITGNVRSYLYTAVRNRALNLKQHERVIQRLRGVVVDALAAGRDIPGIAESPPEAGQEVERGEVVEQVQALVRTLPVRMREILTLRWDHGMSYREIASVLGIREKSAKQHHSRAIAALRQRAMGIFRA
jgi:RNA polymerase sigma-70 factor (ECF subfamily)